MKTLTISCQFVSTARKAKGGNPLDLHSRGIPHLFIVKADGTLVEEGHPAKLFCEAKLRALK